MRFTKVRILRSETEQRELDIGAWEVPILRLLYGDASVEEIGTIEVDRDYPNAGSEYARLEARYRANENDGSSFVSMIYGHGDAGVKKLASEIGVTSRAHPHKARKVDQSSVDPAVEDANDEVKSLRAQLEAANKRADAAEDALDFATAPGAQTPNKPAGNLTPGQPNPALTPARPNPALTPRPTAPTFPKPANPAPGPNSDLATEITE